MNKGYQNQAVQTENANQETGSGERLEIAGETAEGNSNVSYLYMPPLCYWPLYTLDNNLQLQTSMLTQSTFGLQANYMALTEPCLNTAPLYNRLSPNVPDADPQLQTLVSAQSTSESHVNSMEVSTQPPTSSEPIRRKLWKRRSRVTHNIRLQQLRLAGRKYRENKCGKGKRFIYSFSLC